MIYFVQFGGDAHPIKIGHTERLFDRMSTLQTFNGHLLHRLYVMSGSRLDGTELALHRRFHAHRIHGEWFEPADEVVSFMLDNCSDREELKRGLLREHLAATERRRRAHSRR